MASKLLWSGFVSGGSYRVVVHRSDHVGARSTATLEKRDGTDALGTERWVEVSLFPNGSAVLGAFADSLVESFADRPEHPLQAALGRARLAAEAEHDGHLTLLAFTTHWKAMLGTPDSGGRGVAEVRMLRGYKTPLAALEALAPQEGGSDDQ